MEDEPYSSDTARRHNSGPADVKKLISFFCQIYQVMMSELKEGAGELIM